MLILIIEDMPFWSGILSRELQKCGVQSDSVKNGKLGVERIRQGKVIYDGIICDVQMPWMCGIQATKKIRSLGFTQPIVGFSSMKEVYEAQCLEAGMDACFEKSINPDMIQKLFSCLGVLNKGKVTTCR